MCVAMQNIEELVEALLTLAGAIMEAASPVALRAKTQRQLADRISDVRSAGEAVTSLAHAAQIALSASDGPG